VLVPKVDTPEQARAAARACFYPPKGERGINPVRASGYFTDIPTYLARANERTMCMIQVESREALGNAREIAATDGIDVLFIGVGDLAQSLGQPGVVTGPAMDDARARVLDACHEAGKVAGIFAYDIELACQYAEEGFGFVALGNELKAMRESMTKAIERFDRHAPR
jgi:2-keto-3-deoxy-L-rhamnonate aldolase RhmA